MKYRAKLLDSITTAIIEISDTIEGSTKDCIDISCLYQSYAEICIEICDPPMHILTEQFYVEMLLLAYMRPGV